MSLIRCDAFNISPQQGAKFERDLESVKSQVLEAKMVPQNGARLIPQAGDVEPWAETFIHQMVDHTGVARLVSDYADDLPLVDAHGREDSYRVKEIGCAFQFSKKEIQQNARGNINLSQRRPMSARRAIEEKLNRIMWYGDIEGGLFGFFNFPFIPRYASDVAYDGTETAADVLADLNTIANRPYLDTDTVANQPNTMLVSPKVYTYISTTPRSSDSDATIMEYFLANNPFISEMENAQELAGAGPNGEDLIVVYRRELDYGQHKLVEPFTQHPSQEKNLAVITNCTAQTGGYVNDFPQEALIAEVSV